VWASAHTLATSSVQTCLKRPMFSPAFPKCPSRKTQSNTFLEWQFESILKSNKAQVDLCSVLELELVMDCCKGLEMPVPRGHHCLKMVRSSDRCDLRVE